MPISGPQVSAQLQRAYHAAQQAMAEARARAAESRGRIEDLIGDRQESLGELAEHYLPQLTGEAIAQSWEEAQGSLRQILLRKEHEAARLEGELSRCDADRAQAEQQLSDAVQNLDRWLARQQELSEQLADQLAKDDAFKALTQRAAEAEATLERAESSLVEIEHEASQKLPAYEHSGMFMYLWKRGLGTPQYGYRGFAERMDRWVASLIDYPKARLGYEYLTTVPEQVRNLVAKDRQSLDLIIQELEHQRDAEAERLGLPAVVAEVQAADTAREELLSALDGIRATADAQRQQLTQVEDPRGPYYREAIEYLRNLLERTEQRTLEARARQTVDPRDDQIVAQLQHLDARVREVNTETVAHQQRIEWLDKHLTELGQFQQRFRAASFDSSRSTFDDSLDLDRELEMVREGRDTIDGVWSRIRQRQRFEASILETSGSTFSRAAGHPLTQVLIYAMANAASQAMSDHARRAGGRGARTGGGFGSSRTPTVHPPSAHVPSARPPQSRHVPPQSRPSGGGGFHTRNKI